MRAEATLAANRRLTWEPWRKRASGEASTEEGRGRSGARALLWKRDRMGAAMRPEKMTAGRSLPRRLTASPVWQSMSSRRRIGRRAEVKRRRVERAARARLLWKS